MSLPRILGIVCLLIFTCSATIGRGQEYLDLPDEPSGQATSLTDKFLSLTDKFRRKKPQQEAPTNQTRQSRPQAPRYRNTARASLQAQQRARRQNNDTTSNNAASNSTVSRSSNASTSNRVTDRGNGRTNSPTQVQPQRRNTSNVVTRPTASDLLPDTKLFSRSSRPLPKSQLPKSQPAAERNFEASKQLTRATQVPRAGSAASSTPTPRVARLSPNTSRANELDAALADLLNTKSDKAKSPAKIPPLKPSITRPSIAKSTAKPITPAEPVASNTFDLRKALLDDESDEIASAAAEAVEDAIESVENKATEKTKVAAKAPQAPAVADTPQPKPEPIVVATPKVVEHVEKAPVVIEPQVVASKSQETSQPQETQARDAITIATPRPSPRTPTTNSSSLVSDPFESSSNPMRAFQPEFEQAAPAESFARPERGVLQTTQQPVIVSHVEGPHSILVGREATYQVTLENTSTTAATNVAAAISVPEWAELVDAMSTSGVVERNSTGANAGALEWKLSELAGRSSHALRLRLIPRSGRPLQLGVRWSQAPVQSQAVVEVQEPKLELAISGPQEVRFGKPQRYRLTLRNPGTGTTEQVSLRLVPPGGDPNSATTQKIGNLKAGEVRDIDLELTAREAGELLIQADAVADGGLKAETTKTVLCRKPELKVDWRGPDKKYAGTVAAYYFRVSNPGTAATDPVSMSVKLPVGTEFVSASEGFSIDTATGVVSWSLASLEASEEQFMQLRCKIARPGTNDFVVTATADDNELKDSKAFQTDVVALADLKLEVSDPQGPLPLGESIVYEIRVRNRGTTGAEHINIVGLFSEGIDPTTVEGAQYTVRDGRVSFHPIKSLPAGREVVLRIHAKASQVGTHIFRTEVTCPKLDIKLAAEETTRFFEDEHRWENGQTPYMAERETTKQR